MKTLNLTFEDKDFQTLKEAKIKAEGKAKLNMKWEDFVFKTICGR